jgi:hypothetical protein
MWDLGLSPPLMNSKPAGSFVLGRININASSHC